jgi:acyl-CoA synthetase (AMP-forming)/AMP-acid ligase II
VRWSATVLAGSLDRADLAGESAVAIQPMPDPSAIPDVPTAPLHLGVLLANAAGSAFALMAVGEHCPAAEFAARVRRAAAGLCAAGFQPGDRLAILLPRCVDEAVAIAAAMLAGGLAVPIHGKLKTDQVAHILADAEPFAVVACNTRLLGLRDPQLLLGGRRCYRTGPGALPVPSEPWAELDGAPTALPELTPDQPAVLLYTSGSTGLPKGIVQSHRNLCLGAAVVAGYVELGPRDHVLALLPFSFDYGLNQLLGALFAGCRLTAADPLGPGELHELLRSVQPTGLAGVPSLWHQVATSLGTGTLTAKDGQSLRYVTNSGGLLQPADSQVLRQHWPHVAIYAMYGLTEAFRSAYLPPAEFDAHPTSFGRALPGVELLLVEPGTGQPIDGPGEGELVHAGALVALGYWRKPEATAAKFRPDPRGRPGRVVYSGDLVRRDAEGRHWFLARLDRLLKVHGHRVSPDEVVLAVRGLPGVGEAAAIGLPGGAEGHRIVLFVAGDPGDADLRTSLQRACRQRLPSFAQPAELVVLASLPHNPNGKIDEAALRAQHRAAPQ